MDEALIVGVFERVANLADRIERALVIELAAVDKLMEIHPIDELHREKVVSALGLAEIVDVKRCSGD